MTTTTKYAEFSEREQQVITRFGADLASGKVFANHVAAARSRYGYEPPLGRTQWAMAMKQVAEMAGQSDALAQVASGIRVNLYGTASQAEAAVWEAIAKAMRDQYDDVIGRSGPEGGRFAPRAYTLAERLQVLAWGKRIAQPFASSAPGIGWCAQAIADAEHIHLPAQA